MLSTHYSCHILIKIDFFSVADFKKNTHISNFMEIRPMGAELFHVDRRADGRTDGQTDITKLTVAFRNFVIAHKNNWGRGLINKQHQRSHMILKPFCLRELADLIIGLVTGPTDSLSTVFLKSYPVNFRIMP